MNCMVMVIIIDGTDYQMAIYKFLGNTDLLSKPNILFTTQNVEHSFIQIQIGAMKIIVK